MADTAENELPVLLKKYRALTREALEAAIGAPQQAGSEDVLDMAARYVHDATYFEERGDLLRALAALAYAHGWLDAGARLGLFAVSDNRLFTVDEDKIK